MTPDLANALFETFAGLFVLLSIIKLHKEKKVRGVSWVHVAFFWAWGVWNLFYYPHLGQIWSFAGGIAVFAANSVWLGQLLWYTWRERG